MKPILFVHGYRALCDLMPLNLPPSPTTASQTLELSHSLFKKKENTTVWLRNAKQSSQKHECKIGLNDSKILLLLTKEKLVP